MQYIWVFPYARFVYVCHIYQSETGPSKHMKFYVCIRNSACNYIGPLSSILLPKSMIDSFGSLRTRLQHTASTSTQNSINGLRLYMMCKWKKYETWAAFFLCGTQLNFKIIHRLHC